MYLLSHVLVGLAGGIDGAAGRLVLRGVLQTQRRRTLWPDGRQPLPRLEMRSCRGRRLPYFLLVLCG